MRRLGVLAETYAVEVVIVLLVLEGMVDTVLRSVSAGSPNTSLWFALSAMGVLAIVIVASAVPVRGSGRLLADDELLGWLRESYHQMGMQERLAGR